MLDLVKGLELLKGVVGGLGALFLERRRVRVTIHKAHFTKSKVEAYFINVTNLSKTREVEITHVWFSCVPRVYALPRDRPLPKRLKVDETWSTWIELDELPEWVHLEPWGYGRVRLSTGKVMRSVENKHVPSLGSVAGGPITTERYLDDETPGQAPQPR